MKEIGKVFAYFPNIGVAGIDISEGELRKGDKIQIKGETTDFEQIAESMQIDKNPVDSVAKGQQVGLKLEQEAQKGDKVYLIE